VVVVFGYSSSSLGLVAQQEEEEMNPEHEQIFKAVNRLENKLIEIETKQELWHTENQKDMNAIANLTRSVEKHCHEIGKLKVHRAVHWVILTAIAAAIILT
jgi:hypothetical protein